MKEPLTLTLDEARALLSKNGKRLRFTVETIRSGSTLVSDDWVEAVTAALNLAERFTPRDEEQELRAAIREWSEANKACSQWVAGTVGNDEDELPLARLSRAERHLHDLAASEGQS